MPEASANIGVVGLAVMGSNLARNLASREGNTVAIFNRSFVAPYSSVQGQLVLVVVVALFAMGMLWMRRLAGVRLPRRFLIATAQAGGEEA